jgi:hypothetical protein
MLKKLGEEGENRQPARICGQFPWASCEPLGRTEMPRVLVLAALMQPAVAALARSVESGSTLPTDSGLEWVYHEGPDFDVCYAIEPATKDQAFGIHLGNFPKFHTRHGADNEPHLYRRLEILQHIEFKD